MPEAPVRNSSRSIVASDGLLIGSALLVACVAGLLFRLPLLGDSLFADELSTYFVVRDDFRGMLVQVAGPQEWTPPLYFAIAWLFSKLGSDPTLLRLPSLLAGVATIPLVYVLGSMTVGRKAGMVGAALVAFSPLMIFYSTEARGYALLALLVLCSTIALLVALERGTARWWVLYAVLMAASMYTHYTCAFILAGQTAWALAVYPRSRRAIGLSVLLAAVLWSPWLGQYLADATNPNVDFIRTLSDFSFTGVLNDLVRYSVGDSISSPVEVPGIASLVLMALGLVVASVHLLLRDRRKPDPMVSLILILAFSTPVLTILVSTVGPLLFLPRTMITSFPGLALAVAVLVTSRGRRIAPVATACVLAASFLAALATTSDGNRRADYGVVVDRVQQFGEPGDPIVDLPFPTPGAWQALEAELDPGSEAYRSHPVFRLGAPTLQEALRIRRPGGPGQFPFPPLTDPGAVARQVQERAENGRFFLVFTGAEFPASSLERVDSADGVPRVTREFLRSLPPCYEVSLLGSSEGLRGIGASVYMVTFREECGPDGPGR